MTIREKTAKAAVALLFVVLTVMGLCVCDDYGTGCDEWWEQSILQSNLCEYAAWLQGEESETVQRYAQLGVMRISESAERDHGECAYYPFAPLLERLSDDPHREMVVWHACAWLWFMAGCWALYAFCREAGQNRVVSFLGMLLLYLSPRFFADGHYNNKDMVLLSLVLCTLWLGIRFLKKPGFLRGVLLSLAGAMATNTKIAGALAWGLMGLCAVILVTADKRWNRRMAAVAGCTVASYIGFYILLTPASWTGLWEYIRYVVANTAQFSRWKGMVLFRGELFDQTHQVLPRDYLPWMMIVTLPLYVLPLAAAGQAAVLWRVGQQKTRALRDPVTLALMAVSLNWLIPFAFAVVFQPTMYNGWRHFYFVFAGIAVLGACGISTCFRVGRYVGGDCGMQYVFLAGLLLFYGWTAGAMIKNHPCQFAYFNRLGHESAETGMELDYWDIGAKRAVECLLETEERNEELPLEIGALDDMGCNALLRTYTTLPAEKKELLTIQRNGDTPYLYSNSTYARIYDTEVPRGYHELLCLESYGVTVCKIYEKNGKE